MQVDFSPANLQKLSLIPICFVSFTLNTEIVDDYLRIFLYFCCPNHSAHKPDERGWKNNTILVTMDLENRHSKLPVVRVGFIGLGERGCQAVRRWCHIPNTQIVAACDLNSQKISDALTIMNGNGRDPCAVEQSAEDLCRREDVDLVYICTDWESHTELACLALSFGKHVAVEVPAAMTIKDCWRLVDMAERQQRHCMMLENACYDYFEMATAAMAQAGKFGTIVNATGGYHHWLNDRWEPWRLRYNHDHRGDVYPTHGLGPVCLALGIHRTDYIETLVSMDSAAVAGPDYYKKVCGDNGNEFRNGDVTTTLLRTRLGKTIVLDHDVMTPRPYSRLYQLVGTTGFAAKYPQETLWLNGRELTGKEVEQTLDEWLPEDIRRLRETAAKYDNRGGISYIMDSRLVSNLRAGRPMDMDVYDLAEWCAVVELSRVSIEKGSVPVAFPDFRRHRMQAL